MLRKQRQEHIYTWPLLLHNRECPATHAHMWHAQCMKLVSITMEHIIAKWEVRHQILLRGEKSELGIYIYHYTKIAVVHLSVRAGGHRKRADPGAKCSVSLQS